MEIESVCLCVVCLWDAGGQSMFFSDILLLVTISASCRRRPSRCCQETDSANSSSVESQRLTFYIMFVLNKITYYTDKNKKLGKNIERSDNWFHALMPYNILSLSEIGYDRVCRELWIITNHDWRSKLCSWIDLRSSNGDNNSTLTTSEKMSKFTIWWILLLTCSVCLLRRNFFSKITLQQKTKKRKNKL